MALKTYDSTEELIKAQEETATAGTEEATTVETTQTEQNNEAPEEETGATVDTVVNNEVVAEETTASETTVETVTDNVELTDETVLNFLREKHGYEGDGFESLTAKPSQVSESLKPIQEFIEETGRSVEDYFTLQSLNTEGMDDLQAVRVQIALDNPGLTGEEIDFMVSRKYPMDEDSNSEDDIKHSKLSLKLDAKAARDAIEGIRSKIKTPVERTTEETGPKSITPEGWSEAVNANAKEIDGLTFNLNGEDFTFSLGDDYINELQAKNSNLEGYFDSYKDQSGNWNYDKFNSHRALVDNIDAIVSEVYKQGISAGQKTVVETASRVEDKGQTQQTASSEGNLTQQLKEIVSGSSGGMVF
jgi:hypothetical protein